MTDIRLASRRHRGR